VLATLLTVSAARAQPRPLAPERVGVVLPDCPREPFPYDTTLAALRVELLLEGVARVERVSAEAGARDARIVILTDCGGEVSAVVVEVVDPRASGALRRTDLADVPPPHRPRAVALVAAELARSVWTRPPSRGEAAAAGTDAGRGETPAEPSAEPARPATPLATPPAPPAPPGAPEPVGADSRDATGDGVTSAASPARHRLTASPAVVGRLFLSEPTALAGLGARLGWGRWSAGVDGLAGQREDALGSVTFGVIAGTIGVDLLRHEGELGALRAGARAAAGIATAAAHASDDAHDAAAREAYLDLALELGAAARLSRQASATLTLEGGAARALEIYADERRIGVVGGPFVGARVGLKIAP